MLIVNMHEWFVTIVVVTTGIKGTRTLLSKNVRIIQYHLTIIAVIAIVDGAYSDGDDL